MDGFVRLQCQDGNKVFIRCPFSNVLYQANEPVQGINDAFSMQCPNDPFNYQACGKYDFALVRRGPNITLVCGNYVCLLMRIDIPVWGDWHGIRSKYQSGTKLKKHTCTGVVDCYYGEDEAGCTASDTSSKFGCFNWFFPLIDTALVCDRRCDCLHPDKVFVNPQMCDDEYRCNGYEYVPRCKTPQLRQVLAWDLCNGQVACDHIINDTSCTNLERCTFINYFGNISTMALTNYSRCLPLAICLNKHDQTNCSDDTLVALYCKIDGKLSGVSQHVVCNRSQIMLNSDQHPNTSAICDDGLDKQCYSSRPSCYIHKHQLCDFVSDCPGSSDETSPICKDLTITKCYRNLRKKLLPIPYSWLGDGTEDCDNGADENLKIWKNCTLKNFKYLIPRTEMCTDVWKCLQGIPKFIKLEHICDRINHCANGNSICKSPTYKAFVVTPAKKSDDIFFISYCLPGLHHLQHQATKCKQFLYPQFPILGTEPHEIFSPFARLSCKYFYGEQYTLLSCSGKCSDAQCKVQYNVRSYKTCSSVSNKIYSITQTEVQTLVLVKKNRNTFKIMNVFECSNGNCISFAKVCNLIDDCGDGSDEENCVNNFICNENSSSYSRDYISLNQVCDGHFDCLDKSDEKGCCMKEVITNMGLKIFSWIIGSAGIVFNVIAIIRNLLTVKKIKTVGAFHDRMLILMISFGDMLVACYLILIAVVDRHFSNNLCENEFDWLVGSYCVSLGVISTSGSQISLFTITISSLTRVSALTDGIKIPRPVYRKDVRNILATYTLVTVLSALVAVIPIIPYFEEIFINALHFPDVKFLKGFVTKQNLEYVLSEYYGRLRMSVANLSWKDIRFLLHSMFTSDYGGITESIQHFYGNDPVCLFKYFVVPDESQLAYAWSILAINLICFILVSVSYMIVIIHALQSSAKLTTGASSKTVRKRNKKLQTKVAIIVATDFLCWTPFIAVSLLNTLEIVDASSWYALFSIVILPLNSVINPLLYNNIAQLLFLSRIYRLLTNKISHT